VLVVTAGPVAAGGGVPWLTYQQGRQLQKTRNQPMLIFFHLPYCYRCREMKRKVFSKSEVIGLLKRDFIPVEVDVDQEPALSKTFQVSYIPTFVLVSPQGKEIMRLKGVIPRQRFMHMLRYVSQKAYLKMNWEFYLEKRP
jgi:thioredoxin-related protein